MTESGPEITTEACNRTLRTVGRDRASEAGTGRA